MPPASRSTEWLLTNVLGDLKVTSGPSSVSNVCDMKLHSGLLGGVILTKPCVSPQVFHGSMRLTGYGRVAVTAGRYTEYFERRRCFAWRTTRTETLETPRPQEITRNKAVWRFASHAHSMTPNIRVIAGIHRCPWLANRRENRDREGYLVTIENALTARHEAGVWSGRQTPAGGHFLVFSCRCAHLPTRDEARTIGVVPIGGSPAAASHWHSFTFSSNCVAGSAAQFNSGASAVPPPVAPQAARFLRRHDGYTAKGSMK